jgi:hypothetical protein
MDIKIGIFYGKIEYRTVFAMTEGTGVYNVANIPTVTTPIIFLTKSEMRTPPELFNRKFNIIYEETALRYFYNFHTTIVSTKTLALEYTMWRKFINCQTANVFKVNLL